MLSDAPQAWDDLLAAIGPASLLVVIESRMSERLRRHTTPEDIWQEALLHAWRDRHQFEWRGLKSFRAWLLTLIDHRIHEAVVHGGAQKRGAGVAAIPISSLAGGASSDGGSLPGPLASTTRSRLAILREQAAAMQAALESLPSDQQAVVRLRLFEQLTLEQTAERIGITVAAVRHRFARGAELYRERLRAYVTSQSRSVPEPAAVLPVDSSPEEEAG